MAKNQYKSSIEDVTKELYKQLDAYKAIDAEILKISKNARTTVNSNFSSAMPKDVNERLKTNVQYNKQLNATKKEQQRVENALTVAIAKNKQANDDNNKALAKQRFETQQINKANKEQAVLTSSLSSYYQKQTTILNQLTRRKQDLLLKQKQGITLDKNELSELKRLTVQQQKLSVAIKQTDAAVGRHQRNVGNYSSALGKLGLSFRSVLGAFGLTSGIMIFAGMVKDALNRVREFDKSMQNLAGVFRSTREELAPLESTIISVAGKTIRTSNEVAKLAESLATLGKSPEQIEKLLKPVIDLSLGLNAAADEAGEFLVMMLNAFGAGDDEAAKYADTIATIRTSTTLDFQKMRDSFAYIAPISRLLNKDLAYTGSVVGILADNSLKAEQAGRLLSTAQIKLATQGKTLNDALDEINDAYDRGADSTEILTIAGELFGKQAAKVGAILALNSEQIDINAQAIRDNGGALEDLTNQQLESLDAKLKILDSTYEKFILGLDSGNSVIGKTTKFFIDELTGAINHFSFFTQKAWGSTKLLAGMLTFNSTLIESAEKSFASHTTTLQQNTVELNKQSKAYVDLHGSLAPFTEEQQRLIDKQKEINELFESQNSSFGALDDEEVRTLNKINEELKEQKELLNSTDVTNKLLLTSTKDKIKELEKERDLILGVSKGRKESIKEKQRDNQETKT